MSSMAMLIVYYLVLPFCAAALVLRFIKKYGRLELAPDIKRQLAESPIEKKFFRAVRRDSKELRLLGDFETHVDAVDCAYMGRKEARARNEKAAFLVLNDKGETLEQVDS
jgi:hypothetical protein